MRTVLNRSCALRRSSSVHGAYEEPLGDTGHPHLAMKVVDIAVDEAVDKNVDSRPRGYPVGGSVAAGMTSTRTT